ncbi:D-alanyl-D-alanine carboxypeptidase family protein [Smaragdicoccus niigatensis]|uniref:D-alanyl-D-alanine carboxypeptidase family protein n=1 Tax=Smaragdicoccus niigatensis TaxID=359359 RepID=UPI00036213F1|nr:D-alanyl-D-alanine carboxypeptidase family protein [Smaragdicoccus niigatensis]
MARLPLSMLVAAAAAAVLFAPAQQPDVQLVSNVQSETDGLNPVVKFAYTLAKQDAAKQHVPLAITSGHRTWAQQQALWQQGVAEYGSPQAARRWVLPPAESAHVKGRAIDVRPIEGARWLERNGNKYGLCRRYLNEWWHFEVATLPYQPCPAMLPDASYG